MNIAVVGAGVGGTSIINSLNNLPQVIIRMVVDLDLHSPGIVLAKKLRIPYSQSIEDINNGQVDLIIEATGNSKVTQILNEKFGGTCCILDSNAALLIKTLANRDNEHLEKMNHQISIIQNTSSIVQKQTEEIATSVERLSTVTESLLDSTKTSYQYIEKSDKIIQSVNKIAQQTKILGINASIEAARAGEQGKGFSIVAKEVQSLGNYSENSAAEINNILVHLTSEMKNMNQKIEQLKELSKVQTTASTEVNEVVHKLVATCKENYSSNKKDLL